MPCMSYDLAVYARRALSPSELDDLLGAGLHADACGDHYLVVTRGAQRRYSFSIDGPSDLEPDDIPEEVTAVVLGAAWLYRVLVEGSFDAEIPHAVRFARRLAGATDGAVLDEQTDEIWSRSRSRRVARPARDQRIDCLDLGWYCLRQQLVPDAPAVFLRAAERFLPEGLPRRYGTVDPLQGKLSEGGAAGFVDAWAQADSSLSLVGTMPCVSGHLDAGPAGRSPSHIWSMGLSVLADPTSDPSWHRALQALFVTLADQLPAFLAVAQVTTDWIWSQGQLWADARTDSGLTLMHSRRGWLGLPPGPVVWVWLGAPYAAYSVGLPQARTTPTQRGMLYRSADAPGRGDSLLAHLPEDLFAVKAPSPGLRRPLVWPAPTIPAALSPDSTDPFPRR